VLFCHNFICGHSLTIFFQFYWYFDDFEVISKRKFALNPLQLKYTNLLKLRYLLRVPGRKSCMHDVLQPFKYCSHIKFQVNISNGSRVLEAIPSENQFPVISGSQTWSKSCLILISILYIVISDDPQRPPHNIFKKSVFSALFGRSWQAAWSPAAEILHAALSIFNYFSKTANVLEKKNEFLVKNA
jgi:hypothetical protein